MPIYNITLLEQKTVAQNTVAFTFAKPEGFTFIAGQYGGFTIMNPTETDEKGNTRRFSYFSAPDDPHLTIVTRIQTSAFKRNLQKMPPEQTLKMAGPTGNFVLHEDANIPAVFIAGGIGLAPFHSMIKDALIHRPEQQITLFYGNQTQADSAYLDELTQLQQEHPQFLLIPALANPSEEWTGEKGYITDEMLIKHIADLETPIFYVCGSPAMVNAIHQVLKSLQINESHIKVEDFPGY